ncbi:MAG: hypothetical protein H0W64_11630 [Gammaproteobacteria bacterium]|nr:hypothetical protein [Gammaproteobacteria bacterium]
MRVQDSLFALNINLKLTEEDLCFYTKESLLNLQALVNQSYRKLARKAHPDKGGKSEAFETLNTAKNTLLVFIEKRLKQAQNPPEINNNNNTTRHTLYTLYKEHERAEDLLKKKKNVLCEQLNKNYSDERNRKFHTAFETYKSNHAVYYEAYVLNEYLKYLNQLFQNCEARQSQNEINFQQELKALNPLFRWIKKEGIIEKKQQYAEKILNDHTPKTFETWKTSSNYLSSSQWQNQYQYQNFTTFYENAGYTKEGQEAAKACTTIYLEILSRQGFIRRAVEDFGNGYISLAEAEERILEIENETTAFESKDSVANDTVQDSPLLKF